MSTAYYGKYRGVVTNINDPKGAGRIKVRVPSVTGNGETGWCLPCLPYAGGGHGIVFIPQVGDNVWVEFERGNVNYPIWTGCWLPTNGNTVGNAIIKTSSGTIHLRDGEIWLTNAKGDSVSVSSILNELKQLRTDFQAADNTVRSEFKSADDSVKNWADGKFRLK